MKTDVIIWQYFAVFFWDPEILRIKCVVKIKKNIFCMKYFIKNLCVDEIITRNTTKHETSNK